MSVEIAQRVVKVNIFILFLILFDNKECVIPYRDVWNKSSLFNVCFLYITIVMMLNVRTGMSKHCRTKSDAAECIV